MPPPTKRRKTQASAVEVITFDGDARQEYLTGFHKRKLQRTKQAQEVAEKKARAERIEDRRKLREERKADLERHVQEVNTLLKQDMKSYDSEDAAESSEVTEEWDGITEPPEVDHEAEYIDEDRYTTVTIETIDVSKEGFYKAEMDNPEDVADVGANQIEGQVEKGKPQKRKDGKKVWTKEKPKDGLEKTKKKRKKFRYENKAERKFTRLKEKSKNSKQAKERRSG